jgi:histidine triad (HIT) family protein
MDNCLFCKIVKGEIPADIVYENKDILGFRDIDPKAPLHILIIPKKHIESINKLKL